MIKNWNTQEVKNTISKISYHSQDHNLTGFLTWELKKELYEILWHTQDCLKNCSNYGDLEKEYVKKREQEELLKALKD